MKKAALFLLLTTTIAASAQPSSCSSDGVPAPRALLERFINADCAQCWSSPQAPEAAAGTLAIDWVVPGSRMDNSQVTAWATLDGHFRLEALGKKDPLQSSSQFTRRTGDAVPKLRVVHGLPVNDYVGTSIELPRGGGPWKAWLLLVETLPAGTQGSAVERNLVRNSFMAEWPAGNRKRYELRPMRVVEGTNFERLKVVGWLEDKEGKIRAIVQGRCGK